jgi:hypothetical protein
MGRKLKEGEGTEGRENLKRTAREKKQKAVRERGANH